MTRLDTDLIGLQIVAMDDASVVGEVDGLVIDDIAVKVAGFLVDLGLYEASVLPFGSVRAIGNDAIIVPSGSALIPISEDTALEALACKEISVSDAKAITKSGKTVGTIGDFYVDTDNGEIVGLEFIAADRSVYPKETAVLPASTVHRLGRDLVVLNDDYAQHLLKDASSLDRLDRTRTSTPTAAAELTPVPAAEPTPAAAAESSPVAPLASPAAESGSLEETAGTAIAEAAPETMGVAAEETAEPFSAGVTEAPAEEAAPVEESESPVAEVAEPVAASETATVHAPEPAQAELDFADDTVTQEVVAPAVDGGAPAAAEPPAPAAPAAGAEEDTFTTQQKHFLIGKRVLRRIEGPNGELIAEEGDLVTFEMIQKAKSSDQLLILSLNVE